MVVMNSKRVQDTIEQIAKQKIKSGNKNSQNVLLLKYKQELYKQGIEIA